MRSRTHGLTFVAGHHGMVGRAIVQKLEAIGHANIVVRTRLELDLTDQSAVYRFLESNPISEIYIAAAKVGGILANSSRPADFIHDNLVIQSNLIGGAHAAGIHKLLFLGSSCIYPKFAPQPIPEDALLSGPLEPTNESYAIAKIAGIKLCESYRNQYGRDYRSVMPTNLYGPHDNFHPTESHVLPALIRRFVAAQESGASHVAIWGSGTPRREFLHVEDLADACVAIMSLDPAAYAKATVPDVTHINVGSGDDISIADLARLVARLTGFQGEIDFDTSKPDGTPRKLLDSGRLFDLGWKPRVPLEAGIRRTIDWYLANRQIDEAVTRDRT